MSRQSYFLLFLCLIFFIIKIISIRLTNFDLFADEAQYWLWSQNIDFGYYSKPPLLPWTISLVCWVFGNSVFAIKMIAIFLYVMTSFVVYLISKRLFNNIELAFLTALTFFLMPAVSVSSFLVSTDILLVFFWSMGMLQLLIIKERPNKINFILLGIFVGLAFLAKYAAIYFILCIVILFFEKKMRNIFLDNRLGFFYFILTIVLIIAPNIVWNLKNGWITFFHTIDNASLDRANLNFIECLKFVGAQIIMVGPLIFLFFILGSLKNLQYDFNTKFLLVFSFPIFFIVLIESVLVRANANWAAVSLISFLILFVHIVFKFNQRLIFFNNTANLLLGLIIFFLIATNSSYEPFKRINGISSFANLLVENNPKSIETLVVSDRMLFSSLGYIFRNNKITMYTPYTPNSRIEHHFQFSNALPDDLNKNFIFIGYENQLKYLKNKYTINLLNIEKVKFINENIKIYEVVF